MVLFYQWIIILEYLHQCKHWFIIHSFLISNLLDFNLSDFIHQYYGTCQQQMFWIWNFPWISCLDLDCSYYFSFYISDCLHSVIFSDENKLKIHVLYQCSDHSEEILLISLFFWLDQIYRQCILCTYYLCQFLEK